MLALIHSNPKVLIQDRGARRATSDKTIPSATHRGGALGPEPQVTPSDIELLSNVLLEVPHAWRRFQKRFERRIHRCLMSVGQDAGVHLDAEDIAYMAQEVSFRMVDRGFRRLRMYRTTSGASVATWVSVIARSTARDCVRRLRRQRSALSMGAKLGLLASDAPSADMILEHCERRVFVQAHLAALPLRDREFVRLYYAEAHPPKDVAAHMRISVSTVYSKKSKIEARLARELQSSQPSA